MTYIVINFYHKEELCESLNALTLLGYYFSNVYYNTDILAKRLTDVNKILLHFQKFPCSIVLGSLLCKKEWIIYPRNMFFKDNCYNVVTLEEFINNHTDFIPDDYKLTYGE